MWATSEGFCDEVDCKLQSVVESPEVQQANQLERQVDQPDSGGSTYMTLTGRSPQQGNADCRDHPRHGAIDQSDETQTTFSAPSQDSNQLTQWWVDEFMRHHDARNAALEANRGSDRPEPDRAHDPNAGTCWNMYYGRAPPPGRTGRVRPIVFVRVLGWYLASTRDCRPV